MAPLLHRAAIIIGNWKHWRWGKITHWNKFCLDPLHISRGHRSTLASRHQQMVEKLQKITQNLALLIINNWEISPIPTCQVTVCKVTTTSVNLNCRLTNLPSNTAIGSCRLTCRCYGHSGNSGRHIKEVTLHQTRLVIGWVTVYERVEITSVCNQTPRTTANLAL